MNQRFFALPQEKQQRILNAGFRVFSESSYRKSPVAEIAAEAGISKALLFHYFHNKRELYLFLWQQCVQMTLDSLRAYGCYEQTDLFEVLRRGLLAKMAMLARCPQLGAFSVRVFYEKDPEVCAAVQQSYAEYKAHVDSSMLARLDLRLFRPELDAGQIVRQMYLAAEGYLWEMLQNGPLDVPRMERETLEMMEFWKKAFLREDKKDDDKAKEATP